jgi:hypothetical protein
MAFTTSTDIGDGITLHSREVQVQQGVALEHTVEHTATLRIFQPSEGKVKIYRRASVIGEFDTIDAALARFKALVMYR